MKNASVNSMHTILASSACKTNTGGEDEIYDAKMCVVSLSIMGNAVFCQWRSEFVETAVYACFCVCDRRGRKREIERDWIIWVWVYRSWVHSFVSTHTFACSYTLVCTLIIVTHNTKPSSLLAWISRVWQGNTLRMKCCAVSQCRNLSVLIRNQYLSSAKADLLHSTRWSS